MQVVVSTFPSQELAAEIVRKVVIEHLAACGNILPCVRSIYHWQGKIEDTEEVIVLFKTMQAPALALRIASLHPYQAPEILTLEDASANPAYTQWVEAWCQPAQP